ncbi:hypothetical protein AB4Y45_35200 [Paraburkholderia sp. EG287A]|uniref:hypothetical protein n=1 Tax=Paraburkholderia sp. EG287A TaxID=3237012 RepID=UPI0034D189DD
METLLWTVVRFPNGNWSYGGRMDDPDYERCEKWSIEAESAQAAVKKAQSRRRRDQAHVRAVASVSLEFDLSVRISSNALTLRADDTYNLVQQHVAEILILDDRDRDRKIGELLFDVVDVAAMMDVGIDPVEALNDTDVDAYMAGKAIYEPDSFTLRSYVLDQVEPLDPAHDRFLHLRELFIEPAWRGRKFGLAALHIVLQRYSRGCDFAVLCASPIRAEVVSEADRRRQQAALRDLYARAGFKRLGNSLYMVQDLYRYSSQAFPFSAESPVPEQEAVETATL